MSIRAQYEKLGAAGFYSRHGSHYRNPHESAVDRAIGSAVDRWAPDLSHVLDLACGSGEATIALRSRGARQIHGIDPFTAHAYLERTGAIAEAADFQAIAAGHLRDRKYSLIVCSYALHLIAQSRLPGVTLALAEVADHLLVVSPHKRPIIKEHWGWRLLGELVVDRVRARYYRSRLSAISHSAEASDGADDRVNVQ
jgi:SAM-dependent methyltransferase